MDIANIVNEYIEHFSKFRKKNLNLYLPFRQSKLIFYAQNDHHKIINTAIVKCPSNADMNTFNKIAINDIFKSLLSRIKQSKECRHQSCEFWICKTACLIFCFKKPPSMSSRNEKYFFNECLFNIGLASFSLYADKFV